MSSSVCAGIAELYLDERTVDFTFLVPLAKDSEEVEAVPAHKLILSLASDVFKSMFYGDLPEKDVVTVPDTTSGTFRTFLKFFYTGKLEVDYEDAFDLLYLAKKYQATDLIGAIASYLEQNANGANILFALSHGILLENELLNNRCLGLWKDVEQEATLAVCSDCFLQLDKQLLLEVVKRDISVDENLLYGRVIAWAKSECSRSSLELDSANIRDVLGEVLFAIRFPLMTMDEFCKGPALEGYLTAEEKLEVVLWRQLRKKPLLFTTKKRYRTVLVCERFTGVEQGGYDFDETTVVFAADKDCLIHGFGIYGPIAAMAFKLTALLVDTNAVALASTTEQLQSSGGPATYRITFKEPVKVQAGLSYAVCIKFDAKYRTLDGCGGMRYVTVNANGCPPVKFTFSDTDGTSTVAVGQVPEILFSVD